MTEAEIVAFSSMVTEIVRRAAASGPLPRGWSHLGLDHAGSASLGHIAALARQGIFRKYEQVLFLEDGFGAASRWAAAQLGCRAIASTSSRTHGICGRTMTASAALVGSVVGLVGAPDRIPVRDGAVTHVWAMESLARVADPSGPLEEAFRTVRRGGQFAIVEPVAPSAALDVAGRRLRSIDWWTDRIRAVGFVDLVVSVVGEAPDGESARIQAARSQLHAKLAASDVESFRRVAADAAAFTSARDSLGLKVARIAARRP